MTSGDGGNKGDVVKKRETMQHVCFSYVTAQHPFGFSSERERPIHRSVCCSMCVRLKLDVSILSQGRDS